MNETSIKCQICDGKIELGLPSADANNGEMGWLEYEEIECPTCGAMYNVSVFDDSCDDEEMSCSPEIELLEDDDFDDDEAEDDEAISGLTEFEDALVNTHMKARYGGRPCPHCGVTITGNEHNLILSAGGKFLNEGRVAAHPTCFYIHEASEKWREENPEYAPDYESKA